MGLDDALKQLKFDKRMEDWNLRHGVLTEEEKKKELEGLEDSTPNVEFLNVHETSLQKADFEPEEPAPVVAPAIEDSYSDSDFGSH